MKKESILIISSRLVVFYFSKWMLFLVQNAIIEINQNYERFHRKAKISKLVLIYNIIRSTKGKTESE